MTTDETNRLIDGEPGWVVSRSARRALLAALTEGTDACGKMSWEDFYAWTNEDRIAEWVDGEVIMPSPVSVRHQRIANFIYRALFGYVELHAAGEVLNTPIMMKLADSAREPDVMFVRSAHLERLKDTYLDGPADLVIEVLSPESVGRDRGEKFFEYEKAGIPEYWLIDPATHRAEFYQLDSAGKYALIALDAEGIYRSAQVDGFWLRVAWLWQEPLPEVEDVLLEVGGEAYIRQQVERLRRLGALPSDQ
jgi:Uma2 family endonuclease